MIAVIFVGAGFIVLVAIVVGILDAVQAPTWRLIAAQRREQWQACQPTFNGRDLDFVDGGDDD